MPQENVELVRRGFDAFNRRDFDAALAMMHDSITWVPLLSPEASLLRGKDAIRALWQSQVELLDVHIDLPELIPVGETAVVAVTTWRAHGDASGAAVEQTRAMVFHFQEGKIARVEPYASRAEALGAARGEH